MSSYGHNFFFIMQMLQKNSKKRHRFFPKNACIFSNILWKTYDEHMKNIEKYSKLDGDV